MPQGWTVVPESQSASGWTPIEEPRMATGHGKPERTWTDTAVDALPAAGGFAGGLIGGIGGTAFGMGVGGVPGSLGGAAVGGAGGEAAKQLINRLRGKDAPATAGEAASEIGTAGAMNAAADLAGAGVGKGLQLAGRGLYRAGALPLLKTFGKYGDLIKKGLDEAVPVTKAGEAKAAALKTTAQATKQTAVEAADASTMYPTKGIVDDALSRVEGNVEDLKLAGLGDASKAHAARGGRIITANGPALSPSRLEKIKGTVDDMLGPAYQKLRQKEGLNPTERMNMALSHAAGDAQASAIPGYKALNKNVMDAEGLRQMIARRLKGNQGLENALTMAAGPAAIPARIMMLPGVASSAGIAAYKSAPAAQQTTRALLAALMASHQPQQEE